MEKHFLSHFEVLCSTWAICGYNIHMPFLANVIQQNLRSLFPFFLFQQSKKPPSERTKPCTSDLNVCVDTTLKEGSVQKLRHSELPDPSTFYPTETTQVDDGRVETPEVTHWQQVHGSFMVCKDFRGSENPMCSESRFCLISGTCNSWSIAAVGCGSGLALC